MSDDVSDTSDEVNGQAGSIDTLLDVPITGFIVNYNLTVKSTRREWFWIPTPIPTGTMTIPLPIPTPIQVSTDNMAVFNRLKAVKFAYGIARHDRWVFTPVYR